MEPVQPPTTATRPRIGERVLTFVSRDPLTTPNRMRNDTITAAAVTVLTVMMALSGTGSESRAHPDALGWVLLVTGATALCWRRTRPMPVMAVVMACVVPYHALDNPHHAPILISGLALYTVAVTARPRHMLLFAGGMICLTLMVMFRVSTQEGLDALRTTGWTVAVVVVGTDVRVYRRYIASVVARAEHAERTREEEAARRVAEERLRIARDLHDLLAHTITLIGVQTSVASHVLNTDPERLDRAAIAKSLDDIAETCRTARGELRSTLTVLRTDNPESCGPLPDLAGIPDLVRAAKGELSLRPGDEPLPAAVGAAAYRIVQESLTNAVRHAGPAARIEVAVERHGPSLRVMISDDGTGPAAPAAPAVPASPNGGSGSGGGGGFGIVGMGERARSVGGTLTTGPRDGGGFTVTALLPFPTEAPE
ncbi:sensor histidine kinase [Streptomyces sp. NPDC055078]